MRDPENEVASDLLTEKPLALGTTAQTKDKKQQANGNEGLSQRLKFTNVFKLL